MTSLLGVWIAVLVVPGTTSHHSAPVQVAGSDGVVVVAAGGVHSLVGLPDGTLWATGGNDSGQLGQGTPGDRLVPMQVEVGSRVLALSASSSHSLAVRSGGAVWAWGFNRFGQLGDGSTDDSLVPLHVREPPGRGSVVADDSKAREEIAPLNTTPVIRSLLD